MQFATAYSMSSGRAVVRDVVEIAFGIRTSTLMVGGSDAVAHGEQSGGHAGRAAAPCGWPIRLLSEDPANLIGVAVEGQLHGARFDAIVQFGGGAVIVDIPTASGATPASFMAMRMVRAGSSPHSSSRTR